MFYQLTDNVFIQDCAASGPVWQPTASPGADFAPPLCHAVQFYHGNSSEAAVQGLVASSMQSARARTKPTVKLLAVPIAGERDSVPSGFEAGVELKRTARDIKQFAVPRPLPLLFDILDAVV